MFGSNVNAIQFLAQDSDGIEDVIVTATKTEANAQDVPMVVEVLSAAQIRRYEHHNIRDIDLALPSLLLTIMLIHLMHQ